MEQVMLRVGTPVSSAWWRASRTFRFEESPGFGTDLNDLLIREQVAITDLQLQIRPQGATVLQYAGATRVWPSNYGGEIQQRECGLHSAG